MNACKLCKKPASTYLSGRPVEGTVAGTRARRGNYYCQVCIDANAAAHKAYQEKSDAKRAIEYAAALARIQAAAL